MNRVGVLVVGGAGYIATNALRAFHEARQALRNRQGGPIDLELLCVADPRLFYDRDPARPVSQEGWHTVLKNRDLVRPGIMPFEVYPRYDSLGTLAIKELHRNFIDNPLAIPEAVLIYDGTNTNFHMDHLQAVNEVRPGNIFYLGEKPLLTDPASIGLLLPFREELTLFCDFVETENSAVRAIKSYLTQNSLAIDSLSFWRTGSSGIKHRIGHEQQGVEGGAMLDKVVHDLSISTYLLEPDAIGLSARGASVDVISAETHHLVPTRADGIEFLTSRNDWVREVNASFDTRTVSGGNRWTIPVDGLSEMRLAWRLNDGRRVAGHYVAGWIGITAWDRDRLSLARAHPCERQFIEMLASLGHDESAWLMVDTFDGPRGGVSCTELQARIAIIEASGPQGKVRMVANLINFDPKEGGKRAPIRRWVAIHHLDSSGKSARTENLPLSDAGDYRREKTSDMARVFQRTIECICGRRPMSDAAYIGTRASLLVHDVLLRGREAAIQNAEEKHRRHQFNHPETISIIESQIDRR